MNTSSASFDVLHSQKYNFYQVPIFFPADFYELWGGIELKRSSFRRDPTKYSVVLSDLPLFLRAGHIIALHDAKNSISAENSRLRPIYLKIGLKCNSNDDETTTNNTNCEASGQMMITNTMHFTFESTQHQV